MHPHSRDVTACRQIELAVAVFVNHQAATLWTVRRRLGVSHGDSTSVSAPSIVKARATAGRTMALVSERRTAEAMGRVSGVPTLCQGHDC